MAPKTIPVLFYDENPYDYATLSNIETLRAKFNHTFKVPQCANKAELEAWLMGEDCVPFLMAIKPKIFPDGFDIDTMVIMDIFVSLKGRFVRLINGDAMAQRNTLRMEPTESLALLQQLEGGTFAEMPDIIDAVMAPLNLNEVRAAQEASPTVAAAYKVEPVDKLLIFYKLRTATDG